MLFCTVNGFFGNNLFNLVLIETPDRKDQRWYQHLLTLFALFFMRAIPKRQTFGLCLYVLCLCSFSLCGSNSDVCSLLLLLLLLLLSASDVDLFRICGTDLLQASNVDFISDSFSFFFLRSSIGGVAYVTVSNSSATWAATFRLRGYKCMLVIFVFPSSTEL